MGKRAKLLRQLKKFAAKEVFEAMSTWTRIHNTYSHEKMHLSIPDHIEFYLSEKDELKMAKYWAKKNWVLEQKVKESQGAMSSHYVFRYIPRHLQEKTDFRRILK